MNISECYECFCCLSGNCIKLHHQLQRLFKKYIKHPVKSQSSAQKKNLNHHNSIALGSKSLCYHSHTLGILLLYIISNNSPLHSKTLLQLWIVKTAFFSYLMGVKKGIYNQQKRFLFITGVTSYLLQKKAALVKVCLGFIWLLIYLVFWALHWARIWQNPLFYDNVILLVPALYISLVFFTLIWQETWYNIVIFMVPRSSL